RNRSVTSGSVVQVHEMINSSSTRRSSFRTISCFDGGAALGGLGGTRGATEQLVFDEDGAVRAVEHGQELAVVAVGATVVIVVMTRARQQRQIEINPRVVDDLVHADDGEEHEVAVQADGNDEERDDEHERAVEELDRMLVERVEEHRRLEAMMQMVEGAEQSWPVHRAV